MADGRPSERGIVEVADDAGNVIKGVNRIRLGPGLSASYNPADPSVVIDSIGGSSVSVNLTVDTVSALRALSSIVMLVAKVANTSGYDSVGDGGGATYDWVTGNTDADDGALTIKVSAVTVGRWKFRMPESRIFPLASSGLDGTGATHIGTALTSLVGKLINLGYSGIDGSGKKYNLAAQHLVLPSRDEGKGWNFNNVTFCGDGHLSGGNGGVISNLETEIGITGAGKVDPLAVIPYGDRTWTQTLLAGMDTFNGVTDIRNLNVGDSVLCRYGSEPADASGVAQFCQIAKIVAITPTTGTAGNIQIDQTIPETPFYPDPAYSINVLRQGNKHDILKITGFQDDITYNDCRFETASIGGQWCRNFTVKNAYCKDTIQFATFYSAYNTRFINCTADSVLGVNLGSYDPTTSPYGNYGWFCVLNQCHKTNFHNLSIERFNASGGVCDNEATCRDTTFTGYTNIGVQTLPLPAPFYITNGIVCTPYSYDIVTIEHLSLDKGGEYNNSENLRIGTLLCGTTRAYTAGLFTQCQPANVQAGQVNNCLVFRGNEYRVIKNCQVLCNPITVNGVTTFPIPVHGIVRKCRIMASSVTGITNLKVGGAVSDPGIDLASLLVAGQWVNMTDPCLLTPGRSNFVTDSQSIVITTNGSFSSSTSIWVDLEIFCVERLYNGTDTFTDTSTPNVRVFSSTPNASANFVGQIAVCEGATSVYTAISVGAGSLDWIKSSGGGDMFKSQNLSGLANYATARTNMGLAIGTDVQAHDSDLDAISALSTTSYGRGLLTLSGQAAFVNGARYTRESVSAATVWTNATPWAAGEFERVIIRFRGTFTSGGEMKMQVNGDSGSNYSYSYFMLDGSVAVPNISGQAANATSNMIVSQLDSGGTKFDIKIELDIFKDGSFRIGQVESISFGSGADTFVVYRGGFKWHNTSDDVTTVTLFPSTGTMSGIFEVWGLPV